MQIKTLIKDPVRGARYAERYVNDGSPSGFSSLYTTSPQTSPFGLNPWFHLSRCQAPADWFRTYGSIPEWPASDLSKDGAWLLLHPDMVDHKQLQHKEVQIIPGREHRVVPTASGRTVQYIRVQEPDYVKLHYDRILGRIYRGLPFPKAASGVEISTLLVDGIDTGVLDERLAILPETGARSLIIPGESDSYEWGMTWRSHRPYGKTACQIHFAIPGFSLFSTDRFASYDRELLIQIIQQTGASPVSYVMEQVVVPALECYFSMVGNLGLQPEWNAQNLLFGIDENLNVVSLITRDLKSVMRDFTIRKSLGLSTDFLVAPYQCIDDSQYDYAMIHSFMYDHKLGDYVLDPILSLVSDTYGLDIRELREAARDAADPLIRMLPAGYFPDDGCWYMYKPILIDQGRSTRPYLAVKAPKYRSVRQDPG